MLWKLLIILWCVVQKVCSPRSHSRGLGRVWERKEVNSGAERCVHESASTQASQQNSSLKKDEATVKVLKEADAQLTQTSPIRVSFIMI